MQAQGRSLRRASRSLLRAKRTSTNSCGASKEATALWRNLRCGHKPLRYVTWWEATKSVTVWACGLDPPSMLSKSGPEAALSSLDQTTTAKAWSRLRRISNPRSWRLANRPAGLCSLPRDPRQRKCGPHQDPAGTQGKVRCTFTKFALEEGDERLSEADANAYDR